MNFEMISNISPMQSGTSGCHKPDSVHTEAMDSSPDTSQEPKPQLTLICTPIPKLDALTTWFMNGGHVTAKCRQIQFIICGHVIDKCTGLVIGNIWYTNDNHFAKI